ncbi:hypothetical protein L6452_38480 [Arctium lappa]|uniref:Uncharacterized protein n=1 Tax=Arctium lappa TaxID=4217 RepID=A0ACB8XQT6_ARCLA|nr:hypothetical protein L6452_38480 [Arctium lappa]
MVCTNERENEIWYHSEMNEVTSVIVNIVQKTLPLNRESNKNFASPKLRFSFAFTHLRALKEKTENQDPKLRCLVRN